MNKADQKNRLPQEGTSAAASTGESLSGALDMSSLLAITRAPGSPSYSGGGQNSPNMHSENTQSTIYTKTPTQTPMKEAVASQYRGATAAAADVTQSVGTDVLGLHTYSEEGISRPKANTNKLDELNPFHRGGAVQRSPPTKNADQGPDDTTKSKVISEDLENNIELPTGVRRRKGSLGSIEKYLLKVGDTGIFARPLGKKTEGTYDSARESEAEASDWSLASSASTASGTRKRRQPYLYKPGKAKKTVVDDGEILDPYVSAPVTKTKKDSPTVETIQYELKDCTTSDIMARILESMSSIEKMAESSCNLRGAHGQSLRLAARSTLAAVSELAQRSSISDVEKRLREENDELRSALSNLQSELTNLTAEVKNLRQRDNAVKEPKQQQAGESSMDKDLLVHRLSALIDKKLADFRAEILPQKVFQSTLGEKPETDKHTSEASQPKGKKNKKRKKPKEDTHTPQPATTQPGTPAELSGPTDSEQPAATWAKAVGRKIRASTARKQKEADATLGQAASSGRTKKVIKTPSAPKTAAITITLTENATVNYAAAMAIAKQRVNLADCGILQVRQKKALTGGLVLEIPGPDSAKKADVLAERLRIALIDMGIRIARPIKTGEVRVLDLDESIAKQDVVQAIAEAGECPQEHVKAGEIRYSASRLGTVWVRCPLTAIRKLAVEKHLRIGWISARVRVLPARQLQCFRCLELGHVRKQCSSAVDRSLCCYSCGEQGHKARDCEAKVPRCPVCADLGRPADHRLGSLKCNPSKITRTNVEHRVPQESCKGSKTAQAVNQPSGKAKETLISTS